MILSLSLIQFPIVDESMHFNKHWNHAVIIVQTCGSYTVKNDVKLKIQQQQQYVLAHLFHAAFFRTISVGILVESSFTQIS